MFEPRSIPATRPRESGAPRHTAVAPDEPRFGLSSVTRALRWLRDLQVCMDRARTFGLAAETAFWLFLSLIPLAAVAGLAAARISRHHWDRLNPLLTSLPPATRELVQSQLTQVARWNGGAVGITGTVGFVWLASSGVHALFDALELETGARRPWARQRAIAVATCLGLCIAVALLTLLSPGLDETLAWVGRRVPGLESLGVPRSWWTRPARLIASLAVGFGYVCALYWVGVPRAARRGAQILPGAAVAVGLQAASRVGYGYYLSYVGNGTAYTAGLSVVGLTLMALYLFALALLTGAIVNRRLAATRGQPGAGAGVDRRPAAAGSRPGSAH
jgi:membrane protein